MKKAIISITLIISVLFSSILSVFASDSPTTYNDTSTTVTYFEDGSYIVTTITSDNTLNRSSTFTKSGSKEVLYYNGEDELEWEYILYGEFNVVSGVSAVCTSATYSQAIYGSRWSFSNGQATALGNTAYGVGNFTKKVLFITTSDVEIDISFTCDVYGNITSE